MGECLSSGLSRRRRCAGWRPGPMGRRRCGVPAGFVFGPGLAACRYGRWSPGRDKLSADRAEVTPGFVSVVWWRAEDVHAMQGCSVAERGLVESCGVGQASFCGRPACGCGEVLESGGGGDLQGVQWFTIAYEEGVGFSDRKEDKVAGRCA